MVVTVSEGPVALHEGLSERRASIVFLRPDEAHAVSGALSTMLFTFQTARNGSIACNFLLCGFDLV